MVPQIDDLGGFVIAKPDLGRNIVYLKHLAFTALGLLVWLREPPRRNERGISQSAESAILLAGAVAVAIIVVTLITAFVRRKLAEI